MFFCVMKIKNILSLVALGSFAFGSVAEAQVNILPVVRTQYKDGSVSLQDLSVKVDVVGNIATTTFDMTFHNSSSRVLEGEFEFPLGEGQTVSRYALDINGTLREGVVVEKEKGRKTFEDVTRRNVDPGLLEKTKGNNFKTRIYPFNPDGTRRVLVAYEQELKSTDGKCFYRLPLASNVTVQTFSLNVLLQNQAKPVVDKNGMNLSFQADGDNYKSNFEKKNYKLNKDIVIEIPKNNLPSVFTENAGATTYFYTFANIKPQQKDKVLPKSLTVIYDVSSSAQTADQQTAISLLKDYANACGIKKVRLVTFSYKVHTDEVYSLDKAVNVLENCAFDGATQLGCIDFSKYNTDEILFFSDGLSNIGKPDALRGGKPVHVINASAVADHPFLRSIAASNHGNYINLASVNTKEALRLLTSNVYSFLGAKYNNEEIKDVYPSLPCPVGESFSLAGVLLPKTAEITLYFGFGNQVVESLTYKVSALKKQEANNVKRIWAQKKLAELEMDKKRNNDEITLLAKQFGIVTDNTSLIVLDRVEDYVRYGIVPPAELRNEYNALVMNKPTLDHVSDRLPQSIIDDRNDFLKWWNTKFDPDAQYAKAEVASDRISLTGSRVRIRGVSSLESRELRYTPTREEPEVMAEMSDDVESFTVSQRYGEKNTSNAANHTKISIQYWNPDVPYLSELKSTPAEEMYAVYLKLKKEYAMSPSFYMDVADYFYREKQVDNAIRIVSNLCELKLEDPELLRSCAKKLEEYQEFNLAVSVLEDVVKMRGEEPQSYRDLALACAENSEYQRAADLFYKVSSRLWDDRFRRIQQITLNELNALIAAHPDKIDTSGYDPRLMGNCPVDIRISLQWNVDNSDIDLWVTDPNGEKCMYNHNRTVIGGRISDDVTRGYGPEEFCLKVAKKGKYKIECNYYGSSSQKVLQPVVVTATVFTDFGKPTQKKQVLTLRLENVKGTNYIGEITF